MRSNQPKPGMQQKVSAAPAPAPGPMQKSNKMTEMEMSTTKSKIQQIYDSCTSGGNKVC